MSVLDELENESYIIPSFKTCSSVRQIAGCLKFRARFLRRVWGFDPSGRVATPS